MLQAITTHTAQPETHRSPWPARPPVCLGTYHVSLSQPPPIKRAHQSISLHAVGKRVLAQARAVRPGLAGHLLADGGREAAAPAGAGPGAVDVGERGGGVDEARVAAQVVVDRGQLEHLAQQRDPPDRAAEVLVPDDGLGYGFGLRRRDRRPGLGVGVGVGLR